MGSISRTLAIAIAVVASAPLGANTLLPSANSGELLAIPLETAVPAARLRITLDGEEISGPFRVEGETLLLVVPDDLVPGRHDLVVWPEGAIGVGRSERFLFDVSGNGLNGSAILSIEAGIRTTQSGESENIASGTLGVDLTSADTRSRLAFRVTRPDGGTANGDVFELNSFEMETTRAILGQDVTLKFGDHNLPEVDLQTDSAARRGLSVTIEAPNNRSSVTAFALRPTEPDGENESGLEDEDDLVYGLRNTFWFGEGQAFKLSTFAYNGRAATLPTGNPGDTQAAGARLSALLFDTRAEVWLGAAASEYDDGTDAEEGFAVKGGVEFGVLSEERPDSLTFGIEARQIEATYFSALDPGLIRDETGVTATAEYISAFWQVGTELDVAETNVADDPDAATDRLVNWTFDARYNPNDFTGSWLNGTTFFLNGEVSAVDRQDTPAGAPDPTDNTFRRLSFGADRFRADTSWTLSYSIEELKDRVADAREWGHFVDGVWSRKFPDGRTLAAAASVGDVHKASGAVYGETDISLTYLHIFGDTDWTLAVGAGFTDFEDPSLADGSYANAELSWEFHDDTWLVMAADYGKGSEELDLVGAEGWQFGLFVRSDIDLLGAF